MTGDAPDGDGPPPPWVLAAGCACAAVPGPLALALAPELDAALTRLRVAASRDPRLADELPSAERAAEAIRRVGVQWRDAHRWWSAHGRADVVVADIGADSTADREISHLPPPPAREIDVSEAAGRLGVSARHVRRLAASGAIAGRRVGGRWLLDREAVDLMRAV